MAKNIEPSSSKISEYLKLEEDTVFSIPEYQRAYSWGISHCDKLWQDIYDYDQEKRKETYFFGTIIISCQNDDTIYSLIDGQQRTTTFLLLLKALLLRINTAIGNTESDEDSSKLCSALQDRRKEIMNILYKIDKDDIPSKPDIEIDREICEGVNLMENLSINEPYKDELKSILESVDYVEAESKVVKIPRKQKDNKYTNFFRNFKFFYEKAYELSEPWTNKFAKSLLTECEVIEIKSWKIEQAITMFNSLNSDGLPLCDSDIISAKLYSVAEKSDDKKLFKETWEGLMSSIGTLEQKNIVDVDDILMQQMYYERARRKEMISETGSIDVTTPGLRRYYTEINKDLLKDPIALCNKMDNLAKMWEKVSDYPIIQILLKFNRNSLLYIAGFFQRYSSENINEEEITEMSNCLLRLFAVLELVDIGYSSTNFKTFLFGELVKIVDPQIPIGEIKADFDNHISEIWDVEAIKESINDYDDNALVYLNEYLYAKKKELSFSLDSKYDIEHIMPVSGANIDSIKKDADIENDDIFKSTVNKLGNKILLEERINRSIGNEWFRTKISTTLSDKTGYIDSKFPLAKSLVDNYKNDAKPYWTKKDIDGATGKASKRIANYIFDIVEAESEEEEVEQQ